jgi:hypothetical protein
MTQNEQVLDALRRGPLTPLEALADFGIMRLGARVWELNQEGHRIETELVEVQCRGGRKTRVAKYQLVEERLPLTGGKP